MVAEKEGICDRYQNEEDIVSQYLVDYSFHLAYRRPLSEIDFPIDELEEHFSECKDCWKIIRQWIKIWEELAKFFSTK